MTLATFTWLSAYLEALADHPQFVQAQSVIPLWLAREGAAEAADHAGMTPTASRITIQMAAELFPRMALVAPAGAGKTTLLRQLAGGLAEAHRTAARDGGGRSEAGVPIPLFVEMAQFAGSIPATLARTFGMGEPELADLAHDRPLLFLLDGLDELAPEAQLASLASVSATLAALGTQARWIASCRSEHLPLFRPWLGAAEVRSIRPLQPREVIATVERQRGKDLADWLRRADGLVNLATRPRWLAGLVAAAGTLGARMPYARGRLLADWTAAVVAATL